MKKISQQKINKNNKEQLYYNRHKENTHLMQSNLNQISAVNTHILIFIQSLRKFAVRHL
jgi:hypothetical protein